MKNISPNASTFKNTKSDDMPAWAAECLCANITCAVWESRLTPGDMKFYGISGFPFLKIFTDRHTVARSTWLHLVNRADLWRVKRYFTQLQRSAAKISRSSLSRPVSLGQSIDYRMQNAEGANFWVRHVSSTVFAKRGQIHVRGFIQSIDNEKKYQQDSLHATEREQARIAQDLHDDICQMLTATSCLIQVSAGRIRTKARDEAARLDDINKRIIETMNHARALCQGLHPLGSVNTDLPKMLGQLAVETSTRFQIQVRCRLPGKTAYIPKHTNEQILLVKRISQEAIGNAVRHRHATAINIVVKQPRAGTLHLSIENNGRIFPDHNNTEKGLGLNLMHYRAQKLGGEIIFEAKPDTRAVARLLLTYPIRENQDLSKVPTT